MVPGVASPAMLSPQSITHVLYHANCADGFGAAYAAWLVLGAKASYLPVRHGDTPPMLSSDAQVAIVDFSYPREALLSFKDRVQGLIVLDHHKSAAQELEGLDFAVFDLDRSGARMAWDYWHPVTEIPQLLAYVEDRDLWRWLLPESREVSTALHSYAMEFELWQAMDVEELKTEGRAILRYQNLQIARAVGRARHLRLGNYKIPTVNSCLFQSEIGDELCKAFPDAPFSGVYYLNAKGVEAWSLRSIGDFDVAAVAAKFGGGGHRNAAGFARPGAAHLDP